MLKPEQIPDEVVEASAIVLMGQLMVRREDALHVWAGMHEPVKEQFRREARAAFVAGLKAWPGVFLYPMNKTRLILPLTEKPDAEA